MFVDYSDDVHVCLCVCVSVCVLEVLCEKDELLKCIPQLHETVDLNSLTIVANKKQYSEICARSAD